MSKLLNGLGLISVATVAGATAVGFLVVVAGSLGLMGGPSYPIIG